MRNIALTVAAIMSAFSICGTASAQIAPYDGTGSYFPEVMDAEAQKESSELHDKRKMRLKRLRDSADRGSARAMYDLGTLLQQGYLDGTVDLNAAYDLYEKAAEKDDYRAHTLLCPAYLLGLNRPVNIVKGMNVHCAKLKVNQPALLFSVAYDYEHGLSGPKDESEALRIYLEAANAGSGDAMNILGLKLLEASGKDDIARKWFRRAAAQGSAEAMFNLAQMAAAGQGGLKDEKEAAWLYINAARRGHKGASDWLAAQPIPPEPLVRVTLFGGKSPLVTQTLEDANGIKIRPLDLDALTRYSRDSFPKGALSDSMEGFAIVHCYITAEYVVDLCLIQNDFPIGYNFGSVVQGLFDGKITVSPTDVLGKPTAHTVMALRYNWVLRERLGL